MLATLRRRHVDRRGPSRADRGHRRVGRAPLLESLEERVVLSVTSFTTAAQFNLGTYTVNANFDQGVMFNVNHDATADQLQLNAKLTTYPVMWIANAGEDTISKIDTNTGKELARYRTWFGPAQQATETIMPADLSSVENPYHDAWSGAAPSRTAVDREGNVYVANRHFDGKPADVIKILANGGIDRNGNGKIDTSMDLNANGRIGTDGGSKPIYDEGEILPLIDTNNNGKIDLNEIQDERIAWVTQVGDPGALGRSLAIDPDGNIWVGLFNTRQYHKLDGATGQIIGGPIDVSPNTPYGAQIDGNGILWGASLDHNLLKLNTKTNQVKVYDHSQFGSDYGIAIGNGKIYQASDSGHSYIQFDPATETFSTPAQKQFSANGVATDRDGNIVVGNSNNGGVTKFSPDGKVIWSAPAQPGTGVPRGVVVDSDNNVWLIHLGTSKISKFQGTDGAPLGVFDTGRSPYTYTDATGLSRFTSTNPTGTWTVVQDGGTAGAKWQKVVWNTEPQGKVPEGTTLIVEARTADAQAGLDTATFTTLVNGGPLTLAGRFIQVRVTMEASPNLVSPVLSDLSIVSANRVIPKVAPKVVALTRIEGKCCQPSSVIMKFDQSMNWSRARDPNCYVLYEAGCDGRLGTRDDKLVKIRSISVDSVNHRVTLTTQGLDPKGHYRLMVLGKSGKGMVSAQGVYLDGTGKKQAGTNFVRDFGRELINSTRTITYVTPKPAAAPKLATAMPKGPVTKFPAKK